MNSPLAAVRRTAPLIVAFALIPLLLTACGGSEPSAQPTGDGGSSTAPSEAPTASDGGGDLIAIADIKLLDFALLDLDSEIRWMDDPITDPEDLLWSPVQSLPTAEVCPSFAGLQIAIGGPDGDVPAPKTGVAAQTYEGTFVQVPIAV